ncbi:hypothetical protein VI26_15855 [Chromobacterium sp. LK1]|nr:hypothetical protein VI26_15855 [Chromobacterium sp. LK1]
MGKDRPDCTEIGEDSNVLAGTQWDKDIPPSIKAKFLREYESMIFLRWIFTFRRLAASCQETPSAARLALPGAQLIKLNY